MSNTHRIDIEPTSLGDSGQRYLVRYAGAVLVESTRNPDFDACRALLKMGAAGQLEMWHPNSRFPARIDIVKGAGLTVEESDRVGPRFARWRARPEEAANAVSRADHSPRNGATEISVQWPGQKGQPLESHPPREFQRKPGQLQLFADNG
jgi:hypothetical protein